MWLCDLQTCAATFCPAPWAVAQPRPTLRRHLLNSFHYETGALLSVQVVNKLLVSSYIRKCSRPQFFVSYLIHAAITVKLSLA